MKTVHWYFDFISPYAWLQSTQLGALRQGAEVVCKPILFAGLLKHWGQKGPAEMASKRIYTYQQVAWYARREGLQLTWPKNHPFNPLPLLLLCAFLGSKPEVVDRLFAYVWRDGNLPDDSQAWSNLLAELDVKPTDLDSPTLKDQIRLNTEAAIARGLFGVPSSVVEEGGSKPDSPVFWGFDSTPMLHAWLDEDPFFKSPGYLGASLVGEGVVRKS